MTWKAAVNPLVDRYLEVGCGRCPLGGTPECKAVIRRDELVALRRIVLASGLEEDLKWKVPTYTLGGKNVVMVTAFKEYSTIIFFKGVLLSDPDKVLERNGENSQSAYLWKFSSAEQIERAEAQISAYIAEAMELERAGKQVEYRKTEEYDVPEELTAKMEADPVFRAAFEALTPGRQRGYLIYFKGAKQSATRAARIESSVEKIMAGKGWQDR